MRLVNPGYTIYQHEWGTIEEILKHIELCGRVCYKSEDKISADSAKEFVERLIKSGHTSVLEHGTVYLKIPKAVTSKFHLNDYIQNKYSTWSFYGEIDNVVITTNYRVLVENGWLEDLQYLCKPTENHEKRVSVKFICDRGVSHEFVRHRVFSFSQESTRYCNYSKDKFGNEITYICPCWNNILPGNYSFNIRGYYEGDTYIDSLLNSEKEYFELIKRGWTPQQARSVLPNSLKTELIMTGTEEQWKHFFSLRDAQAAHPQARELAKPLHEEFIKRGYV